ncbi:type 11 methyltransferase [Actinoplanes sp. SE50]|uniref:class I SAM-dependent DNA methyltransferase n=1 Tax=unclassified Actinoplanes TaxID=2626549 RepID=UPI00023EC9F3|nr:MULTISPECIES: class I SAM-dependent methyltransferase [unclassified Actinoplanes]AEV86511.1 methyltransferase type 11 [Actinoplanes sp. SE50/110]ATO84909.1 type 11 methyltransferase [Actinoplanes sp. SE50]SLM02318.1 type 11 methyltransferase [Actinoplanes sp. SE50/110]
MDASTEELRDAHDVLSEFYATHLAGVLDTMPVERAMLNLFAELTLTVGTEVADVGCGTGRLLPYLADRGLTPRGVDLSPKMIEVAEREHPGFPYAVADLRDLPFDDATLAGVVCWFSLIFLAPPARTPAFTELARVLKPGGYLVTAFKHGDGTRRRTGRSNSLGVDFDRYWLSPEEMTARFTQAGLSPVFQGHVPPEENDPPYGYMLVRRITG